MVDGFGVYVYAWDGGRGQLGDIGGVKEGEEGVG